MLLLDFRELAIKSECDVQRIKAEVDSHVKPFDRPVHAIVNYSGCTIGSAALESYGRMVDSLLASCDLGLIPYGIPNFS